MIKFENLKKNTKKFIKEKKVVDAGLLSLGLLVVQATPVLADISGTTIKNNLLTNFFQPFYIVILGYLLLKEFVKKSYGSLFLTLAIGATIGIFIFGPESINSLINLMKGLAGM